MGMRINQTNPALTAARQAGSTAKALAKNFASLASGLRINEAADDAAGLAVAEGFRARVRQFTRETGNLQGGISMIQTAQGGLSAQNEGVSRLRELAVQASSGTLTSDQRAALQTEAQQLLEQIEQTAQNTEFNGRQVLNGANPVTELGVEGGAQVEIQGSTPADLGLEGLDLSTAEGAAAAVQALDEAAAQIGENQASLGAQQNRLEQAVDVREQGTQQLAEAESRIRDADVARVAIEKARNQALLQGTISAVAQGSTGPQAAARLLGL